MKQNPKLKLNICRYIVRTKRFYIELDDPFFDDLPASYYLEIGIIIYDGENWYKVNYKSFTQNEIKRMKTIIKL